MLRISFDDVLRARQIVEKNVKAVADALGVSNDTVQGVLKLFSIERVRDVWKRVVDAEVREGAVRLFILSTESVKNPARIETYVGLDGSIVRKAVGETKLYQAFVSRTETKCSCDYAVRVASRADKLLPKPLFHKHTLCKHVALATLVALVANVISEDDLRRHVGWWLACVRPDRGLVRRLVRGED